MKTFQVEYVSPSQVCPAAYNPRAISDASFEGLKESLKKFGFVDPLIVNKTTGNLVGGHQRLKAAESLGLEKVPVIYIEASLSEEKALNVTLNNSMIAGHYTDSLQTLLEEIKDDLGADFMADLKMDALMVSDDDWDKKPQGDVGDYDPEKDTFTIKVLDVRGDDKDSIVSLVNEALKGTGYVANSY